MQIDSFAARCPNRTGISDRVKICLLAIDSSKSRDIMLRLSLSVTGFARTRRYSTLALDQ